MPVETIEEFRSLMSRAHEIRLRPAHIAFQNSLDVAQDPNRATINNTDLSLALNGYKPLSYPQVVALRVIVEGCESIAKQAGAPIAFKDGVAVRKLLEAYRSRHARPAILEPSDWSLMQRICSGESATDIARSLNISIGELIERLETTTNRFAQVVGDLRSSNDADRSFTNQQLAEVAARRL